MGMVDKILGYMQDLYTDLQNFLNVIQRGMWPSIFVLLARVNRCLFGLCGSRNSMCLGLLFFLYSGTDSYLARVGAGYPQLILRASSKRPSCLQSSLRHLHLCLRVNLSQKVETPGLPAGGMNFVFSYSSYRHPWKCY